MIPKNHQQILAYSLQFKHYSVFKEHTAGLSALAFARTTRQGQRIILQQFLSRVNTFTKGFSKSLESTF
jgi:hypothetical protein